MKAGSLLPSGVAFLTLALLSTSTLSAADQWFRPQSGFPDDPSDPPPVPPYPNPVFSWDTTTVMWANAASGGTLSAWDNAAAGGSTAIFNNLTSPLTSTVFTNYTLELATDITFGKIDRTSAGGGVTIQSQSTSSDPEDWNSLIAAEEATIGLHAGGGRNLTFTRLNFVGDFSIMHTGGNTGILTFQNSTFDGRITVSNRSVSIGSNLTNFDATLNNGTLTGGVATSVISRVDGVGALTVASQNQTFELNQTDNTRLQGVFSNPSGRTNIGLTKSGSGIFIFDAPVDPENGPGSHLMHRLSVTGGALYMSGIFANTTAINVASSTLGGTFTTNAAQTILTTATSKLAPGLPTLDANDQPVYHAGTLTLAGGVRALNGATFDFLLDDTDSNNGDTLLNSLLHITGGTVELGGTITVNLLGLQAGLLQSNTPYTLFDATGATSFLNNADWQIGQNLTGLQLLSYGFGSGADSQKFQVTFSPIPEPTSLAFLGGGAALLTFWRHRRRKA